MIHRNTYINAPRVLESTWQMRNRPELFFAGQVSGVEGYVESAASGLIAGLAAAALHSGFLFPCLPRTTALGAIGFYVSHASPVNYQPTNIAFGLFPSLDDPVRDKRSRRRAMADRALRDLTRWQESLFAERMVSPSEQIQYRD